MEKITDYKFQAFAESQIAYPQAVYGGYPGETNDPERQRMDQIKSGGNVDYTAYGSQNGPNDGFSVM